jgi:hypothetical protein
MYEIEGQKMPLASFYAYDDDMIKLYTHADDYSAAFWDIGQELHIIEKHGMEKYKDTNELIDDIRKRYFEIRDRHRLPQD